MAPQANTIILRKAVKNVSKSIALIDPALKDLIKRDYKPLDSQKPRPLLMGIDPGLSGAVAVVDMDSNTIIDMIDLPVFQKPTESRKQGYFEMLDVHKLSSLIDMYAPMVAVAFLEEPGAMAEQGLGSTFRFGHVCGQIHGVLAGHYIPVVPIKPAVWKSALALSGDKNLSRLRADMEFPAAKELWTLKKHDDRAEAALLTVYGKKYLSKLIELSRK